MKRLYKYICCLLSFALCLSFFAILPISAKNDSSANVAFKTQIPCCDECEVSNIESRIPDIDISVSSSEELLTRLISKEEFVCNGLFLTENKGIKLEDYYDFSAMSRFEIAKWACENNMISKEQMIESYCDLLENKIFENMICLDHVYAEIDNYASTHQISERLNRKILLTQNRNDVAIVSQNDRNALHYILVDGILIDDNDNVLSDATLDAIGEYVLSIKTAFVNMGFDFPNATNEGVDYIISLTSSTSGLSCDTIPYDDDGTSTTCLSTTYIYGINNYTFLNNILRQRLAHGMFHAIQNTYHKTKGWFKEACADWGAYAVTGLTTNINLNAFINSRDSITANVGHGAMLFPLTIARYYGGAATIVEIYEQLGNLEAEDLEWVELGYAESSFICQIPFDTLVEKINAALDERGYSANFADIYTQMVTYLATPDDCYGFLGVELYNDSSAHIVYCDGDNSFEEDYLEGLEKVYFTFEPDEDLSGYTIEFTLEIFDGVGSAYQYWYNDQGEIYTSSLIINGSGQVTFTHPHYDEGNPSGFVGIAVNGIDEDEYLSIYIDYTVTSD